MPYTESQIGLAMEAPAVHPTGQRKSKITAIQRMAGSFSRALSRFQKVPPSSANASC